MRGFSVAWLQLNFERRRLIAAVAGIAFAVVLVLVELGLREVLYRAAERIPSLVAADLVMLNPQDESLYAMRSFPEARLYTAFAADGVASVAPVYMQMATWKNPVARTEHRVAVMAAPPTSAAFDLAGIRENLEKLGAGDAVLFDAEARPEYGPVADMLRAAGQVPTEINDRRVRVVGLFDGGETFAASAHVFTSDLGFSRLFDRPLGAIDLGLIRLKPGANAAHVRRDIAARVPADVAVLTRKEFVQRESAYWQKRAAIGFIFDLGAAMGLLVGTVIVYQILYTDVLDHLAEYATLKAIGYRDRYLYSVVLNESLILSALGFVPGYALAELVYLIARRNAHVPVEMTAGRAAGVLALTVVMCMTSAAMAMRKLTAADPADIF